MCGALVFMFCIRLKLSILYRKLTLKLTWFSLWQGHSGCIVDYTCETFRLF